MDSEPTFSEVAWTVTGKMRKYAIFLSVGRGCGIVQELKAVTISWQVRCND